MLDTGLADRIRAKGVPVVEVAGWRTRGISTGFGPRGALFHHTAGAATGTVPSLAVVTYGRGDLSGPLSQVLQSRDPVEDKAYVIAAGKANHAGAGYWQGLDSNYELEGLEVEHIGTTVVPVRRLETSARIVAAMLEAPGSTRSAAYAALHREYALPPGRKIDFAVLTPWTPATFRARVGYWVGRTATTPPPAPPAPAPATPEESTMTTYTLVEGNDPDDDRVFMLIDGVLHHMNGVAVLDQWVNTVKSMQRDMNARRDTIDLPPVQILFYPGTRTYGDGREHPAPYTWPQAMVDRFPVESP